MKKLLCFLGSIVITGFLATVLVIPSPAMAVVPPVTVTVHLESSGGSPLSGGVAQYYSSGWYTIGTTDALGNVTVPLTAGTYPFRITYAGGSNQMSQDIGSNPLVVFQTVNVTVQLKNSGGTLIDTGAVQYYASGWHTFGAGTTAGGQVTTELLPNNYPFRMTYLGGSNQQSQDIGSNSTVVFRTINTTVQLKNSGGVGLPGGDAQYYANGWKTFGTTDSSGSVSMELLPNNYPFRVTYQGGSNQKSQNTGDNPTVLFQTKSTTVQLKDSSSALIDTGNVQYYASGWKTFGSGVTSGGQITTELLPNNYPFRMTYVGGSNQKSQDIDSNPVVVFQTQNATVTLKTCPGVGLSGGEVQYYANGWKAFGTTNGSGSTSMELLPNTYPFRITYQGGSNQKSQDISLPVKFTTTKVTLVYDGNIQYYANGWKAFTKPSMELLPNNYPFRFGATQVTLPIADCTFSQTMVIFKLLDSHGAGLSGGTAKYYLGSWHDVPGATDSHGILIYGIPGVLTGSTLFQMNYAYASNQKSQNVGADSTVVFQTVNAVVQLKDSIGNPLDTGTVQYYANGWHTFGTGSTSGGQVSMELLPTSYSFIMTYAYATNQISKAISIADSTVLFQTINTTVQLKDYNGSSLDTGTVQYYANGWHTFGTGSTSGGQVSTELLPNSYQFTMTYAGASNQKPQDNSVNATVVFQTGSVHSDSVTATQYYANGWRAFTQDMELLPNTYPFHFSDATPQTNYVIVQAIQNHIH